MTMRTVPQSTALANELRDIWVLGHERYQAATAVVEKAEQELRQVSPTAMEPAAFVHAVFLARGKVASARQALDQTRNELANYFNQETGAG